VINIDYLLMIYHLIYIAQLYGAATMNNTLGLCIFVALVYAKNLPWTYSAEVLSIFFVNIAVGIIGMKKTLPAFMGIVVLLLYPAAIGLVAFMEKVLNWH